MNLLIFMFQTGFSNGFEMGREVGVLFGDIWSGEVECVNQVEIDEINDFCMKKSQSPYAITINKSCKHQNGSYNFK